MTRPASCSDVIVEDITVTDTTIRTGFLLNHCVGIPKPGTPISAVYDSVVVEVLSEHDEDAFGEKWFNKYVHNVASLQNPAVWTFLASDPGHKLLVWRPYRKSLDSVLEDLKSGVSVAWETDTGVVKWNNAKRMLCALGIASALSFIHEKGIIHRDLRPSNIFLDDQMRPMLGGFALACSLPPEGGKRHKCIGTLGFMAPEVVIENCYDQSADVFSFAMTLFQIFTNAPPFPREVMTSHFRMMSMIEQGERPQIPPEVPDWIKDVMEQCWVSDPDMRPPMSDVRSMIRDALAESVMNCEFDETDSRMLMEYIVTLE